MSGYNNLRPSGDCNACLNISRSIKGTRPPGWDGGMIWLCSCGRRWWYFNDHFHLWKHVTEDAEWDALKAWPWCRDFVDEIEATALADAVEKSLEGGEHDEQA